VEPRYWIQCQDHFAPLWHSHIQSRRSRRLRLSVSRLPWTGYGLGKAGQFWAQWLVRPITMLRSPNKHLYLRSHLDYLDECGRSHSHCSVCSRLEADNLIIHDLSNALLAGWLDERPNSAEWGRLTSWNFEGPNDLPRLLVKSSASPDFVAILPLSGSRLRMYKSAPMPPFGRALLLDRPSFDTTHLLSALPYVHSSKHSSLFQYAFHHFIPLRTRGIQRRR